MPKRSAANAAASKISALYVSDSDEERQSVGDDDDDASRDDKMEEEEEEDEVLFVSDMKSDKKRVITSNTHEANVFDASFDSAVLQLVPSEVVMRGLVVATSSRKRKSKASLNNTFAGFLSSEGTVGNIAAPDVPMYILENSKSNRAKCFKCENKIDKDIVRVGVISDTSMGLFTKWSHLNCLIFHKSITDPTMLDGYHSISPSQRGEIVARVFESAGLVDEDQIPINAEDLVRKEWTEEKEPSDDFTMELLPYQKEGLGWMAHQEASSNAGGILADEMGMGKTAQAIALLLINKSPTNIKKQVKGDIGKTLHSTGGTLIIVPTVAMHQWMLEIAKFTKVDALKVKMYHGDNRDGSIDNLSKNVDVIITTYKILEIEYRKANSHDKMSCTICGKKYRYEQYRNHRKYFCGVFAKRTEKQSKTEIKKANKVIKMTDSDDEDSNIINLADSDEDSISKTKKSNKQALTRNNFSAKQESASKKGRESSSSSKSKGDNYWDGEDDEEEDVIKAKGKGKVASSKKKEVDDEEEIEHIQEIEHEIALAKAKNAKASKDISILHEIAWFRIVLDEAHMIKDRSTSTAKSVFALTAQFRWCLTGTPLQNRVSELYSQIRFLRIDPHAYYYCKAKGCNCKSLNYNFTRGKCDDCNHSSMQHFCHFNRNILNPIKRDGYVGEGRRAMLKLKDQILDEILMRRTKLTRADDIQLPPRIVKVRADCMSNEEEDYYQALYTQSQTQFNTYVRSGTVLNNYAHIFDILIRLRQAVDHPYLVIHSNKRNGATPVVMPKTKVTRVNRSTQEGNDADSSCPLCSDPVVDKVVSACCGSRFCRACVQDYIETLETVDAAAGDDDMGNGDGKKQKAGGIKCPGCHKNLDINLDEDGGDDADIYFENPKQSSSTAQTNNLFVDVRKNSILNKLDLPNFQTSTKLEALMQELHNMQITDLNSKAIVFSQFVNMLDLVQHRLDLGGFKSVMLQGSLQVDQRERVIKAFKENVDVKVLLISLKAGGVALNLTVASHIFIMDPWWNPAAEMQAIDRTHRIGQHRPIHATRFIIKNSIEERILKLQEKKKLVFDSTIGGDSASIAKLTVEDMKFLFQ